jgi:hypothetical protein
MSNQDSFVNSVQIIDSTISIDTSSGSLVISGGLGVQGTSNVQNLQVVVNATVPNLFVNNLNTNLNATIPNLISLNISTGSLNSTNLITVNSSLGNLNTTNFTVSNLIVSGNILTIDCHNSQINPGQLIFKNTAGTGDFKIFGDGGDVQWQGGGSRAMQLGTYHEIRLTGGRTSTAPIVYLAGSNATYNTIIQNTNDSIALTIQANSSQSVDLTQWTSSTGTVYAKIDKTGKVITNSTDPSSITTLGGISSKTITLTSTVNATNTSTGAFVSSGGAGFNGNVYANNIYSNNSQLTPSPLTVKGDIYTYSTSGTSLPIGNYNQILTADSAGNTGMKWKNANFWDQNVNPQLSAYMNLVKLSDQTLTTTGSVVMFPTEIWLDYDYFSISIDHSYFYIKNPGKYIVIAKMTGYNITYNSPTTVRWDVFSDYRLSGIASNFSAEPGCEIYTTHNSGTGSDTAAFGFSWDVPVGGVYAQVQAKVVYGTSVIAVNGGSCSFNLFTIPSNQFIDTWNPNWTTINNTSYTSLSITNVYLQDAIYPFTAPNTVFTTTVTGDYLVCAKLSFQKTSGVDITSCNLRLINQSGTPFTGAIIGSSYLMSGSIDPQNVVTIFWCGTIHMIANTTSVTMQGIIDTGTNARMKGGFLLMHIPSTYTSQINYSISSTSGNLLSSTFIDIPLQAPLATTGNLTYTPSTGVVTINNSGMYLIESSINCSNPSNIVNRTIYGQIMSSYDNGVTWFIIPGSYSMRSIGNKGGIISTNLFQCNAGTIIKLQIKTNGTTGDAITIGTGCNLSVLSPENITTYLDSPIAFGSFYQYSYSSEFLLINTTTSMEIMRLSTVYMPAGIYKVSLHGTINMLNTSATTNVKLMYIGPDAVQHIIYNKNIVFSRKGDDLNINNNDSSLAALFNLPFQQGITQLILMMSCTVVNGANTQNALIDILKVI